MLTKNLVNYEKVTTEVFFYIKSSSPKNMKVVLLKKFSDCPVRATTKKIVLLERLRKKLSCYTAVGGSRAGGSRANFWILRKIMSEALGPVWMF